MNPVNILMVDDQPAKLLAYEAMLGELGENLIKANSAREALAYLLHDDIAVVLMDVNMPEMDGFELAAMIRQHPRCERTAIIFVSAIHMSDIDKVKGYETGAVDYVSVPVIPEILRAKIKVFIELHRKTAELKRLNDELEERVRARTNDLEASLLRLKESETRLRLQGDEILMSDGPYLEGKEHVGGFWIIQAPDLDAALGWARKAARAITLPIEVRPFQDRPEA